MELRRQPASTAVLFVFRFERRAHPTLSAKLRLIYSATPSWSPLSPVGRPILVRCLSRCVEYFCVLCSTAYPCIVVAGCEGSTFLVDVLPWTPQSDPASRFTASIYVS
ncbi:hypothetical protein PIB30_080485 [Stylosanthes scabra]|uniref:Uncharacterized protein n=1 Tax=Stylosanthes scabra TaxID=79078 RepID=A0ABU6USN9_9FABA|nr:hypothetical protein [Stylosanthes scabra]